MRLPFALRRTSFIVAGVIATASAGACVHRANYYDPVNNDYHRWDSHEQAAYRRWETEQNYQDMVYTRRSLDQQRAYWTWRHAHPG